MSNVESFLSQDFSELEARNIDFTTHVQANLQKTINRCAADTEFPVEEKNFGHENFSWFSTCLRNNLFVNPVLN